MKTLITCLAILTASATARAGIYQDQDDAAVARVGVALLTGKLHHIDSVDADAKATGTFAHSGRDEEELRGRLYKIVEQQLKKTHPGTSEYHILDEAFPMELCLAHERIKRGDAAARKQCDDEWQSYKSSTSWDKLPTDPLLRGLWISLIADAVGDPAFAAQARAEFARTAGFKLRWARVDGTFNVYAMVEPVAMGEWPMPVVKAALANAGDDADLKKQLTAALKTAPTMRCVWYGGELARDARHGKLGPIVYAEDLTPAPDVAGSGGEIACSDVKQKHGDPAALAAVKRKDKNVMVVRTIEGRDWEDMVDDAGNVTRKVRPVQVYTREPY